MSREGGKKYKITQIMYCRAQDEWELEEELATQPVAVGGVIYEPGEWNDLEWRTLKATLPPWRRDPGAGDTKKSRNWVPPPGGAVIDRKAVHLAEAKRMRENKMYRFVFLEETEDININVGPQYKTDGKMTEVNKTAQLEEI